MNNVGFKTLIRNHLYGLIYKKNFDSAWDSIDFDINENKINYYIQSYGKRQL